MEVKKSDKANLESKRGLFLQAGLVIVLGIVLMAFEWGSRPNISDGFGAIEAQEEDEDIIPITRQEELPPPPPPPPPAVIEVLNIVDDDMELDDDLDLDELEADQDLDIDIVDYEEGVDEEEVFLVVEDPPSFQGKGKEGFRQWIGKNLKYPAVAVSAGIEGRVYIQFAIDSQGNLVDAKVVRGVNKSLDDEALRVIKSSPKWSPGKQRGKAVKVQFTFPVTFTLD